MPRPYAMASGSRESGSGATAMLIHIAVATTTTSAMSRAHAGGRGIQLGRLMIDPDGLARVCIGVSIGTLSG